MIIKKTSTYEIVKDIVDSETRVTIVTAGGEKYYKYDCVLEIDQVKAYESNTRIARLEVVAENDESAFVPLNTNNINSVQDLSSNLIAISSNRARDLEQKAQTDKNRVLYSDNLDIFEVTPKISQSKIQSDKLAALGKVRTQFTPLGNDNSQTAFDQVKEQKDKNTNSSSEVLYAKLIQAGKDPGKKIISRSYVNDPSLSRKGLGSIVSNETDSTKSAFVLPNNSSGLIDPTTQRDQKYALSSQISTDGLLPITFLVPLSNSSLTKNIYLKFTIQREDETIIQSKSITIDHETQIRKTDVPKKLPTVGFKKIRNNQIVVNTFDKDPVISGVKVYQRVVRNHTSSNNHTPYQEIDTVLSIDDAGYYFRRIDLPTSIAGKTFFRALPFLRDGTMLGNYTSASYIEQFRSSGGVLYGYFNQQSVTISLRGSPANYEYVQFVKRSITKKEKNYTNVGLPITIVEGEISYQDFDIKREHVYEYSAILQSAAGDRLQLSLPFIVRTSNYASGTSLSAELLTSTPTDTSVINKFKVDITLNKDTDTTLLLQNLKDLGIDNFYQNEFEKLSADLKKITKVYITRINGLTGEVANLGLKDPGEFEDVAPQGSIYIFEGVIRSQADLFEELGATLVSPKLLDPKDSSSRGDIVSSKLSSNLTLNKQNFTQKFISKKSLLKSTISIGVTRDYNQDDVGFLAGRLGISTLIDVPPALPAIVINNFELLIADEKRRILRFDVSPSSDEANIDFFIIESVRGTVRSSIGACHFVTNQKTQSFFDDITNLRVGTISYIITPVNYMGESLQSISTQTFEVL